MSILIFAAVFAVLAALCGPASSRRPRVGIPCAAALTLGSAVAAVATWVYTVPLLGAVVVVPALCGAVLLAANIRGALRSRRSARRTVGPLHEWWEECGRYGADPVTSAQHLHAAFAENVAAEEAELFGGAR